MKSVLYSSVCIALLAGVGGAGAADMPIRRGAPPPDMAPAIWSWTGLYIGSHTGVALGRTRTENLSPFGGFDAGVPLTQNAYPTNIFGGGQIGYNWQMGYWLLGAEIDVGYLGIRDDVRPAPDDMMSVKYGAYATFTGRLGWTYDRLLTYVKGGAVVAKIKNTASDLDGTGSIDPFDFSEVDKARWGWTVGSGFEFAIAPQWSVKSEFLYMDFGKRRSTNLDGDTFEHRNRVSTVKAGLNYRWGGAAPVVARY